MTGDYVPQYTPTGSSDFAGPTRDDTPNQVTKATRDFRNEVVVADVIGQSGKVVKGVKEVTITIRNLSGGLNRVWGTARQPSVFYPFSDLDRVSAGNLYTPDLGIASLPPLGTASTTPQHIVNPRCWANFVNTIVVGAGATANKCLAIISTQAAFGSNMTYTPPGGNIVNLSIIYNASSNVPKLAVCSDGAVVDVLSNLPTPSSLGGMHANTNPCWGMQVVDLNDASPGAKTMLMYIGATSAASISTLSSTAAIGDAPTAALSGLPGGGYDIANFRLGNRDQRAYWVLPLTGTATSMLHANNMNIAGTTGGGRIISTNLYGTDQQPEPTPMDRIFFADRWRDTLTATDKYKLYQIDNDGPHDLGLFRQRNPNSDLSYMCMGTMVANDDLYAWEAADNAGASTGTLTLMRYQPATESWHPASHTFSTGTYGYGVFVRGAVPFSPYVQAAAVPLWSTDPGTFWEMLPVPISGRAPFYSQNNTAGSGSGTGIQFEPTEYSTSPAMLIEGLEGLPFVLAEIIGMMDVGAGGISSDTTPASVKIEIAAQAQGGNTTLGFGSGLSHTFQATDPWLEMRSGNKFMQNREFATRLQYRLTLTQGSTSTRRTPNGVPFQLRLLVFLDRKPRTPAEVYAS